MIMLHIHSYNFSKFPTLELGLRKWHDANCKPTYFTSFIGSCILVQLLYACLPDKKVGKMLSVQE